MINNKTKKGTCEVCDKPDVEVFPMHGDKIDMCAECKADEMRVIEGAAMANPVIQQMRAIDTQSELKADLFNQSTVAIVELHGAIWADENIPQERKQYVYTQECAKHFEASQKRVFEKRQELLADENITRAWQVAAQTAAGKLSQAEREHFKKLNVSYQPATVKSVKPATSKAPTSFKNKDHQEYKAASEKYGVPVEMIRLMVLQRKCSAEVAAKDYVEIKAATVARKLAEAKQ